MNEDPISSDDAADVEYESVLLLDELESLLEEIEEQEVAGGLPANLEEELRSYGLASPAELRERIRSLHQSLDAAGS